MEMDAFEANMLLHYQGKGLLPIELQCRQGSVNISYEISGMYSLQQITERRELQEKDLKSLFQAVLTCYEEMSEYLLPPEGILLRPEWLFYQSEKEEFHFCYYPESTGEFREQLLLLAEFCMKHTDHRDSGAVLFIYRLYCMLQRGNIEADAIWKCFSEHTDEVKELQPPQETEKKPIIKEPLTKQSIPRQPIPKQSMSRQTMPRQLMSKQSVSKNPMSKRPILKQSISKQSIPRQTIPKQSMSKNPMSKRSIFKQLISKQPQQIEKEEIIGKNETTEIDQTAQTTQTTQTTGHASWLTKHHTYPASVYIYGGLTIISILGGMVYGFRFLFLTHRENDLKVIILFWIIGIIMGYSMLRSRRRGNTDIYETGIWCLTEKSGMQEIKLTHLPAVLGRKPEEADYILADEGVSRKHLQIFLQDTKLFITDMGSTNGTFLNTQRLEIDMPVEIREGDVIGIAQSEYIVTYKEPSKR